MKNLSRREFLKITAFAGGGLVGTYLFSKGIGRQPVTITDTRSLMGTIIHLKVICLDEEKGKAAINATYSAMERLVKIFNLRDSDSQLSKLNQEGELANASQEMVQVISEAIKYGELTNGAFDVTIQPVLSLIRAGKPVSPEISQLVNYRNILLDGSTIKYKKFGMQITLDGLAKGFVVDKGVCKLKELGFDKVLVEAGGDLAVSGKKFDDHVWRIGVASPRPENFEGYLSVFSIKDGAVATSGDYLNWFTEDKSSHHIVDPALLVSPKELASVTVYAPTAMQADALSTAIMVLGSVEGLELANQIDSVEALVVTKDMAVKRTAGFPTLS